MTTEQLILACLVVINVYVWYRQVEGKALQMAHLRSYAVGTGSHWRQHYWRPRSLSSCWPHAKNKEKMNIEDYREYCLSLGTDVEEKLPFTAFRYAGGVLAFYVNGHMFSFFDCDHFGVITLKVQNSGSCSQESIEELKAQYGCIGKPFNLSPKYWIGVDARTAPDSLLRELTKRSYEIVKAK